MPSAGISPTLRAIVERANRDDFFFVNIGANDGVSNDVIYPFIREYGWRGIVVEPLPPVFEELKRNYREFRGIAFEQVAIAATPRPFFYIPPESGYDRPWARQVGTLNRAYLLKTIGLLRLYEFDGPVPDWLEQAVERVEVPCLTFDALMQKYRVERVDFLNIDAESADYEIFCSIDFSRYRPAILCIETSEMTEDQSADFERRLARLDYAFVEPFDVLTKLYATRELLQGRPATAEDRMWNRIRRAVIGRR
jgi:FkbM family methyltransferase